MTKCYFCLKEIIPFTAFCNKDCRVKYHTAKLLQTANSKGEPTNRILCSDKCKQEYYKGYNWTKEEIVPK